MGKGTQEGEGGGRHPRGGAGEKTRIEKLRKKRTEDGGVPTARYPPGDRRGTEKRGGAPAQSPYPTRVLLGRRHRLPDHGAEPHEGNQPQSPVRRPPGTRGHTRGAHPLPSWVVGGSDTSRLLRPPCRPLTTPVPRLKGGWGRWAERGRQIGMLGRRNRLPGPQRPHTLGGGAEGPIGGRRLTGAKHRRLSVRHVPPERGESH